MSTAFAALVLVALGQVQTAPAPDPRVKAIAPFVDSDVFAVIQVDVARLDVQKLSARILGDSPAAGLADGMKMALRLVRRSESRGGEGALRRLQHHRHAGPALRGRAAGSKGRRLKGSHGRFMPSRRRSITRSSGARRKRWRDFAARRLPPGRSFRPRSGPSARRRSPLRLLILPSADSRRVLEEMMPRFPAELGGGPITDLTHGLIWAAAGIENAEKPALKLVAASRDAEAAKSLVRLGENVVGFLRRSPEVQQAIPDLAKALPEFKPTVAENRITLAVDAHQAAALIDSLLRPGASGGRCAPQCVNNLKQIALAFHNYHAKHDGFLPHTLAARTASRS